jgi:hypothetical protein
MSVHMWIEYVHAAARLVDRLRISQPVYICIYLYISVYICIYLYISVYLYLYTYICIYTSLYICLISRTFL